MDGKTTKSSVSSEDRELKVKRVSAGEVDKSQAMGEWDVKMGAVYLEVSGRDVEIAQDTGAGTSDTDPSGKKENKYMRIGPNTLIMRFKEKIKDIIEGVTLKLRGDRDKEKDEEEKTGATAKKKVVKKVVKKAPETKPKTTDDHEK